MTRRSPPRLLLPSPHPRPVRRQGGFSLLEVVVALAILALCLGILIQIFSRALSTTALSGVYSRATTLAQARLDDVGVEIPLEPARYSGEPEDGLAWEVLITPYDLGDLPWEPAFDVFVVTSEVSWEDRSTKTRQVSLSTLRLANSSGLRDLAPAGEPDRGTLRPDTLTR